MGAMASKADDAARRAENSREVGHAVRLGLVAYGIIHLTFAWLAVQLAFGDSEGEASGTGALQQLAQQPWGEVVLWVIAVGMVLLCLWRLFDAATAHHDEDGASVWKRRAVAVGKAVVYGVLAYAALSTIVGASSGSSDQKSQSLTARVLELPGGQFIVGGVAIGILVVAGVFIWRGVTARHMKDLDSDGRTGKESRAYRVLGTVGHVAKGATIGVVGVLFLVSAVQHDASESGSTDQALRQLLDQPFGPYVLLAMGLGIASFGLFCFAQARHLSR